MDDLGVREGDGGGDDGGGFEPHDVWAEASEGDAFGGEEIEFLGGPATFGADEEAEPCGRGHGEGMGGTMTGDDDAAGGDVAECGVEIATGVDFEDPGALALFGGFDGSALEFGEFVIARFDDGAGGVKG